KLKLSAIRLARTKFGITIPFTSAEARNSRAGFALGELREKAVPGWKEILCDPRVNLMWRTEAARNLGAYPDFARESAPLLLATIAETQDKNLHDAALLSICRFYGPVIVPIMVKHLKSTNIQNALQAISVLQQLGPRAKEAAPELLECLGSRSEQVRMAAAFALNA